MKKYRFKTRHKKLLADILTPVSLYLKIRDRFPNSILLESSDFHSIENSHSYICFNPLANFSVQNNCITESNPDGTKLGYDLNQDSLVDKMDDFISSFEVEKVNSIANGFFGYTAYNAIQHFDTLDLNTKLPVEREIPDMYYSFYKYIISINHYKNELTILENLLDNETSKLDEIAQLIQNRKFATYYFKKEEEEQTGVNKENYLEMVNKGKEHCKRGDVFQIVLSRNFTQKFQGDDFNVYRALRNINPSPYLFYFDFGTFKLMGSSPEAQITIKNQTASINPIAGTFKRTGNDSADKELAEKLALDPKENAEHVMLVDLARNDLSRSASNVELETYKEVQFFSHVIHLVSKVNGKIKNNINRLKVFADTFPAGTLSGAPKYRAMQLIDKIEGQSRGFYGGAIGFIGLNGEINKAILIRSFMSKNNTLHYQAGAGIVDKSVPENELKEVDNKIGALREAIKLAGTI
ncbi:MAG: anthranilate synthase component I [Bacteroidetes bacterium 4572_117]|nr:MAG: anthranilate synthase component I [Bacteroidetes bacterium 4572_117]